MNQPDINGPPERSRHVAVALREAGVEPSIRELPESTRTAADAARALGCSTRAIANSLVFVCDGAPLLVMTSGGNRVDTDALASRLGKKEIVRANAEQVRKATGQAIGGVAPVCHPVRLETVIDETLADHAVIWAAAGTPNTVFSLTYPELLKITTGLPLQVTT